MNLLSKLKLLWKVKKPVSNIAMEVSKMPKSGWRTTEFWLVIVSNLLTIAGALQGVIGAETAAVIVAVLNGIYGVLRTIAKKDLTVTTSTPPVQ